MTICGNPVRSESRRVPGDDGPQQTPQPRPARRPRTAGRRWVRRSAAVLEQQAEKRAIDRVIVENDPRVVGDHPRHDLKPGVFRPCCLNPRLHRVPPRVRRRGPRIGTAGLKPLGALPIAPMLDDVHAVSALQNGKGFPSFGQRGQRTGPRTHEAVFLRGERPVAQRPDAYHRPSRLLVVGAEHERCGLPPIEEPRVPDIGPEPGENLLRRNPPRECHAPHQATANPAPRIGHRVVHLRLLRGMISPYCARISAKRGP